MNEVLRNDIQALRGLAVMLVVLHHAELSFISAGYLGVDIFFVISGFLITRLVAANIERGRFRFSLFYFRRAKRLLPAAYVTFLATALVAPLLLVHQELKDFLAQMMGAISFTANIVLWQQAGYFDGNAQFKPLLHTWSLSLEEQYYLLLPATLAIVPRRLWRPGTYTLIVVSLSACLIVAQSKPVAAFYLLPTRAWELALGSLGAFSFAQPRTTIFAGLMFWPALACLALLPVFPLGGTHPGVDAFLVCLATLVVILKHDQRVNSSALTRPFAQVGNFSYSLYLVHWPIFAFVHNAWVGDYRFALPLEVRIGATIVSLLLGYLLYVSVERPIHKANIALSWRSMAIASGSTVVLMLVTFGAVRELLKQEDHSHITRPNHGLSERCDYTSDFAIKKECQSAAGEPRILVWGDSFAMHLVPGIVAIAGERSVLQATRSQCGPLLDMAIMKADTFGGVTEGSARECISFNRSVLAFLTRADSIELIVLSSTFGPLLEGSGFTRLFHSNGEFSVIESSDDYAMESLRRTISAIRALGKRVIVIAPPPMGDFNIGKCTERRLGGKLTIGVSSDCELPLATFHKENSKVLEFLSLATHAAGVSVIRLDPFLCGDRSCKTSIDGIGLYSDRGHLSNAGSKLLMERFVPYEALIDVASSYGRIYP